jgi:hypothetical protein
VQASKNQEEAKRPAQAADDCQIVSPPAGPGAQHSQAPADTHAAPLAAHNDNDDFQPVHIQLPGACKRVKSNEMSAALLMPVL